MQHRPTNTDFDIFCREHPDLWAPYLDRPEAFDLFQQMEVELLKAEAREADRQQAENEQIQADALEEHEQLDRARNPEFYSPPAPGSNPFEERDPDLGDEEVHYGY